MITKWLRYSKWVIWNDYVIMTWLIKWVLLNESFITYCFKAQWVLLHITLRWRNWNWLRCTFMSHFDAGICLHRSFQIVLWWDESFWVLLNDYVMITSYQNHCVIMTSWIWWLILYESFHHEDIFVVVDFVWKINLTCWLNSRTAVENRLVEKRMVGSIEKHLRSGY